MLNYFFPPQKTPSELLKESRRLLNQSVRRLTNERERLESKESEILDQIKTAALAGKMTQVRLLARNLSRQRGLGDRYLELIGRLEALCSQINVMSSTQEMTDAMKNAVRAMRMMNRGQSMPEVTLLLKEFEKQVGKMDDTQAHMDSVLNDLVETDEKDEEETIAKILDEIGIDAATRLKEAPSANDNNSTSLKELEERYEKLKK